jgi:Response regulators consisting of a CheY-like receiver domain and a winged-helix DNA-binding domain
MLVEDDKSLREIYSIRLVAEGYNIVSAGDGEEALALAAQEKPDLIISDVMMPKISGFDMLDILRSQPETKDIKVIMMTALSSEDQRQRGEMLGADRYLVKSQVGIEDVVNTVHEILGDQPNASAHTSMSTAAVMPAVEQAAKEAEAAEAPVKIDAPTTAETTIAPQNSDAPAPDVNQQMQTAAPEAPAAPAAPQSIIPEPPAPQGPPGGNPVNFNQAPAANPAVATMQPAAGAYPMMPVNPAAQGRKSTGGERVIAPLDDPEARERKRQSNERIMEELLNEGQPAPHAAGQAYSTPQQPANTVPNPQLANNPAMTATSQQFAAQAIANQNNNTQPVSIPPKANMTLSAALQGSAQPSAPKPGSTATMPGQPTPPPAIPNMPPMPPNMPMPPQPMPQAAPRPAQPAPQQPTPQQPAPQPAVAPTPQPATNATPTNSPQQASPQVANPAPQPAAPKPVAKKNPVNNMSPEMIAQVVQATKVNNHADDEVVEAIKPAYISELEEDLSADMDALGGAKNTMAARMLDELKDDEITIAASQMERPVINQPEEEKEEEVELPDALKDVLSHSDVGGQNPNINFSNGEEDEDEDSDNGAAIIVQTEAPKLEDDGMGPTEPEVAT